ncbi:efflux transporter outer membrane subunit [Hymenobacter armeniacus]|uniref:Efflux transporter outer membrane subunit n=1 Tax=Hymenobacter armeniacus TaxID=2771358 RepID=A0ABR8JPJ7_9BACT|nr:efflux transporter outer membrane subunit [Hymenobacter armeniacus]MBD2720678.1 efflux transporter outer membrane subunit [Hymenobacter armeniacus]
MTFRLSPLLTLLLLAGCVRPPSYAPPSLPTPTAWKNTADSLTAATPPAPVASSTPPTVNQPPAPGAWWSLFKDPGLTALEAQATAQNYSLQAAVARVESARANVRVANSYRAPLVTVDPQVYRTRLSATRPLPFALGTSNLGVVQTQYYIPVNASYEVDVWGRIRSSVRAAEADAQVQEATRRTVQLSLTADAATYYFGIRGLDAQLQVLDTARADRQRSLELTRARFQAGVDNEIAVHRAETELANIDASVAETRRQRLGLEASLATVLGVPASSYALPPQAGPLPVPAVPASLPAALLARRPDLQQAERRLAAASARVDVAKLTRLPTLRLNGFLGPQSARLGDLARISDSYTYYVGGGVSIPVFNGGRNRANEQVARSEADALVADYRQAALAAFQEVETSQADVRQYQAQVAARSRALRAARLASALTKERYRAGLTNYFEVVDADRQTLDAATLLTQAQSNLLGASIALVRALGGGWE